MESESKSEFITELPIEAQDILKNINFPAKKSDIIEKANETKAIPDIQREFGMLPDKKYNSSEDVAKELHIIYMGIPN